MNCATCGDQARGKRNKLPCCKICLIVTEYKWESALLEMRRINQAAREEKANPKVVKKAKGSWNG